jgi:hypothetical protein
VVAVHPPDGRHPERHPHYRRLAGVSEPGRHPRTGDVTFDVTFDVTLPGPAPGVGCRSTVVLRSPTSLPSWVACTARWKDGGRHRRPASRVAAGRRHGGGRRLRRRFAQLVHHRSSLPRSAAGRPLTFGRRSRTSRRSADQGWDLLRIGAEPRRSGRHRSLSSPPVGPAHIPPATPCHERRDVARTRQPAPQCAWTRSSPGGDLATLGAR